MRSRLYALLSLLVLWLVLAIVGVVSISEKPDLPDVHYHVVCTAPGMETVDVITDGAPELTWMDYGGLSKDTWVLNVKDGYPIYITDSSQLSCQIDPAE